MNEDLKWLAENVHEWNFDDASMLFKSKYGDEYYFLRFNSDRGYTRAEWQAARDALAAQKEWRGPKDGLPPVGVRCEIRQDNGRLRAGVIGYHTKNGLAAIIEFDNGGWDYGYDEQFRPIRTEEDKAVEEMMRIWVNTSGTDGQRMQALYHAGLRFTEQESE